MKGILVIIGLAMASGNAFAAAKITVTASQGRKMSIALDDKGTPRANGDARTYPTIKDFRSDGDYEKFCVAGPDSDVTRLLTELVVAADGDGDSWADLKTIRKNRQSWTVSAEITDEGGNRTETYRFPICEK